MGIGLLGFSRGMAPCPPPGSALVDFAGVFSESKLLGLWNFGSKLLFILFLLLYDYQIYEKRDIWGKFSKLVALASWCQNSVSEIDAFVTIKTMVSDLVIVVVVV